MTYRTKTYIAGDWTGDQHLISTLYAWNRSDKWSLDFHDAHEITQARDTSLACSIKRSLSERLDVSKTFVLVVGNQTSKLTKGGCQFCRGYNGYTHHCAHGRNVDSRSFIQYECEKAANDGLRIVVLYNAARIIHSYCPDVLLGRGVHLPAYINKPDGYSYWNYQKIKEAIMG